MKSTPSAATPLKAYRLRKPNAKCKRGSREKNQLPGRLKIPTTRNREDQRLSQNLFSKLAEIVLPRGKARNRARVLTTRARFRNAAHRQNNSVSSGNAAKLRRAPNSATFNRMGVSEQNPPTNDGASATPGGNVYYKNPARPRSRHEEVRRVDSATTPPPAAPNQPRGNIARQAFADNIRRFLVFTILMIALIGLSIKFLTHIWSAKDKEITGAPAPSATPKAKPPAAKQGETPPSAVKSSPSPPTGKSDLDTEAIRRALFMAKRGKSLAQSGNFNEAIARYREALEIWPYLTDAWAQIGSLYLRVNDYLKAQIALEKAAESNPSSPEILCDLGVAYLHVGQIQKATKVFETAIESAPQYAPTYFNMALCSLAQKDPAGARANFEKYLRLKPGDPRALREVAYLDASDGKYANALRGLQSAIVEAPSWPLLYFDAAATAALMGRADDAIHYLEQSEALSSPGIVYRLYLEPAFKEIRLSEVGQDFLKDLADRAKQALTSSVAAAKSEPLPGASEPLSSASPEM